jgi:hypothetical protein
MCTTITLEEKCVDVVIDALVKKMGNINANILISGTTTPKMQNDYIACEKALGVFTKAKDSLVSANVMATEKG